MDLSYLEEGCSQAPMVRNANTSHPGGDVTQALVTCHQGHEFADRNETKRLICEQNLRWTSLGSMVVCQRKYRSLVRSCNVRKLQAFSINVSIGLLSGHVMLGNYRPSVST